jgi:hypothetical protein
LHPLTALANASGACATQEFTALPVLYVSQWFLTCFSCPFPAKFACRVIDVMLQERRAHVLLRVALAIVAECEADILDLHDFEDIITYLKVGNWAACVDCHLPHAPASSTDICLSCAGRAVVSFPSTR